MGCYADLINSTKRDLEIVSYDDEITLESCIRKCFNMGYLFTGFENK